MVQTKKGFGWRMGFNKCMSLKEKSQSCISPCQYPIFKNFEYHEPKRKDQSYIISMPSSHLPLQAFFAILPDGENFDGNGWSSARSVLFWICCASFSWHSPTCSFFTRCPSVPLLFSRLLWVCGLFQLSSALLEPFSPIGRAKRDMELVLCFCLQPLPHYSACTSNLLAQFLSFLGFFCSFLVNWSIDLSSISVFSFLFGFPILHAHVNLVPTLWFWLFEFGIGDEGWIVRLHGCIGY